MTYIIGWKNKTSVFIHADSLVTESPQIDSNRPVETTSFGEKPFFNEDYKVEAEVLKIYNLHNKIGVAFSGAEYIGRDVISNFKLLTSTSLKFTYEYLVELLQIALQSVHPYEDKIQLIIGFVNSDDERILMTYNRKYDKQIESHNFFVSIGVEIPPISSLFEQFCTEIVKQNYDDTINLIAVNSFLQNLGLIHYLPQYKFGGFFIGLRIDSLGIHWLQNITYFMYGSENLIGSSSIPSPKDKAMNLVRLKFLDDALVIKSTIYEKTVITYLDTINVDVEHWIASHNYRDITNLMSSIDADHFSFICIEQLAISIVSSEMNENQKFVKIIQREDGKIQIIMNQYCSDFIKPMKQIKLASGKLANVKLKFGILKEYPDGFVFTNV